MEWATSTLLCVLALFLFTEAKEPQLLDSGLKIDFLTEPKECDNPVKMGDVVTIDYEGYFDDGSEIPVIPKATYEFQVGISDVIEGWALGVRGMCEGERRRLTIPPHLAYGSKGAGHIVPGNAVLVFDILLKKSIDGIQDIGATLDLDKADVNNNKKIDAFEYAGLLLNYLKNSFMKHRRGGFIQNGVKTTFKK